LRELHHHSPCCPDDLSGQKDILQTNSLDLPAVFHWLQPGNLEQQEQVVGQHHQLKYGFIGPEGFERRMASRHIILGFLDVILTVAPFLIEIGRFLGGQFSVGDKKGIGVFFTL